MAATNTAVLVAANGNGIATAFDFAFKIFAETDLVVYKGSALDVYTLQVLNTDYTVEFDTEDESGTVTYVVAPVSGGKSVIIRDTAQTQASSFQREGPMPEKAIENALDKLTLQIQEIQERTDRAPLQPIVPAQPDPIVIEAPEDAKGLRYRVDGGTVYIENTEFDPDEAQADAAASAAAAASSAALASVVITTGTLASKPATPAINTWFYSTDAQQLELYVTVAGRWFLIG